MAQDQTKKEALFNEVKGSLFEYLVAKKVSEYSGQELNFQKSLDGNYLKVLSQQDRMVRQFYPEMLPFLSDVSKKTADHLFNYLGVKIDDSRLTGKFNNFTVEGKLHEADFILTIGKKHLPVSLKLNKKNAFVNTKSGGVKSFFSQYFDFLPTAIQVEFNKFVEMEFSRMGHELHELYEVEFDSNFNNWARKGITELPGELDEPGRLVLKSYYSRIAKEMHRILSEAYKQNMKLFGDSLASLMGFSDPSILQVICFHDFKQSSGIEIEIHSYPELAQFLGKARIVPHNGTSSVEIVVGNKILQLRVKPMNKFTSSAVKINCSVKTMRPNEV